MTGPTHLVAGVASLALPVVVATLSGNPIPFEAFGAMAFGALFGGLAPDLDAPASLLSSYSVPLNPSPASGRRKNYMFVTPFAIPAKLLNNALGHRTLLHSLHGFIVAALSVALPLGMVYGFGMALGFMLGYLSHLALDACTVSGIPFLYPSNRRYHCLPPRLRIATGSPEEGIVLALLAGIALFTLVSALSSHTL